MAKAPDESLRRLGADYLKAIDQYARDAAAAGHLLRRDPEHDAVRDRRSAGRGVSVRDGARGWDEYAPFYDWENAQTVARRDVAFWCRLAAAQPGPILELGCGTGRIALPIARSGTRARRDRSLGADAGAGAQATSARQAGRSRAARSRRHPCAALSSSHRVRLRDGALRGAAVVDARARSAGHARVGRRALSAAGVCLRSTSCPTCPAGRNTAGARACVDVMPAAP